MRSMQRRKEGTQPSLARDLARTAECHHVPHASPSILVCLPGFSLMCASSCYIVMDMGASLILMQTSYGPYGVRRASEAKGGADGSFARGGAVPFADTES